VSATRHTTRPDPHGRGGASAGGFTLFELLIVVGIIILVLTITLPTIISMLSSGADAQAYNLLAGQLMASGALALENDAYVALHVQTVQQSAVNANEDLRAACFSAVTWIDPNVSNATTFTLAEGYTANRTPGTLGFGEISPTFVNGSNFQLNANASAEGTAMGTGGLADFTAFSIVFNPRGEVVTQFNGGSIQFAPALAQDNAADRFWSHTHANNEQGIRAVTLFDYGETVALADAAIQAAYLDSTAQFLPVNTYTGRVFPRE